MVLGCGVIQGFRHKGLRRFFVAGSSAGIQPEHSRKLRLQLAALHSAAVIDDLDLPGYRLHPLKGADKGRWAIWVNANWRLTFVFREGHVFDLHYEDYH
ncbi:type II toxin-antitoxin system RelE/ParE family toxin [Synechococcus sp. CS-1333]|uniref:type II toxin-antitoxin system RelE/ParE family toxin n=1 Tax=Synechococcus sp. CS-1333 TaxID=2848638 RepID=UPI00223AE5F8|nr:type II toxin-antitoxin system RelE/ParE family toxin [Synechococcus sp. CS-1333]